MINDHDFFEISKKSNDILDANNEEAFQSISKLHVIKHHSSYFSNLKNKKRIIIKETLWSTDEGGWSNWKTHVSNSFEFFQMIKKKNDR